MCWTNSHLNTAAAAVNSIASLARSLGVEIDRDVYKLQDYELQLPETMIYYRNTALQPSSMSKPSPKSIGGLIGEALLL